MDYIFYRYSMISIHCWVFKVEQWLAVTCWRSSVRYVSCCCQLKYVVKNMILKYVQSNENIMCINVSNFFPFHRSVE